MNTLHVGHIYYMGWHVLLLKEVKKNNGLLEYKAKTKRREVVVVLRTSCVASLITPVLKLHVVYIVGSRQVLNLIRTGGCNASI